MPEADMTKFIISIVVPALGIDLTGFVDLWVKIAKLDVGDRECLLSFEN